MTDAWGLLDFGCIVSYEDPTMWHKIRICGRAQSTGLEEHVREAIRVWTDVEEDDRRYAAQIDAFAEFGRWAWRPIYNSGPFDYGNADYLNEGVTLFAEMARKRMSRSHYTNLMQFRWECSHRMMLYRLGACIDGTPVMEEELPATGWDLTGFFSGRN